MTFNADDGSNRNEIYDVNTLTIGLVSKGRGVENKSQTSAGGIARQKHNGVRETTTRLHEYLYCSIFTPSPPSAIVSLIVVCIMDSMLGIYSTLVSNMREYKTKFWIR